MPDRADACARLGVLGAPALPQRSPSVAAVKPKKPGPKEPACLTAPAASRLSLDSRTHARCRRGTRNNSTRALMALEGVGLFRVGERTRDNLYYEVGTTDL